jgi:hypothetical protein
MVAAATAEFAAYQLRSAAQQFIVARRLSNTSSAELR